MAESLHYHRVSFEQYAQGYIATSESLKGLFVSHTSLAKVYEAVPVAIRLLYKADHGIEVSVREALEPTDGKHKFENATYVVDALKAA